MGLTCCDRERKSVSSHLLSLDLLRSIPDLRKHGCVADAVGVELGGPWWDVVVHEAWPNPRGQDAHVVLPRPGGPVVEPQS